MHVPVLIDNILEELMMPLRPAGVRVYKKVGPMPRITADGRRVAQILFNLIGNALKARAGRTAMPGGGCARAR